jgi:hypothetical protein
MERRCPVLINGKPCNLGVKAIHGIESTFTVMHVCPMGHRSHFFIRRESAQNDVPPKETTSTEPSSGASASTTITKKPN